MLLFLPFLALLLLLLLLLLRRSRGETDWHLETLRNVVWGHEFPPKKHPRKNSTDRTPTIWMQQRRFKSFAAANKWSRGGAENNPTHLRYPNFRRRGKKRGRIKIIRLLSPCERRYTLSGEPQICYSAHPSPPLILRFRQRKRQNLL